MDGEDILDEDRTMTIDNASNSLGIHSLGTTTLLVVVIVFFLLKHGWWMGTVYTLYICTTIMKFIPKGQFHAHFWDSSEGDKGLQTLLVPQMSFLLL